MSKTYKGSCVCGAIQLEVTGSPDQTIICFCHDCRKNSGNLGQITACYDLSNVKIIDPENQIGEYVITKTGSGKPKHKEYCLKCGCTIRTIVESLPGKNIIRPTLLEEGFEDFTPQLALFEDEKARYTKGVHCEYYWSDKKYPNESINEFTVSLVFECSLQEVVRLKNWSYFLPITLGRCCSLWKRNQYERATTMKE